MTEPFADRWQQEASINKNMRWWQRPWWERAWTWLKERWR